MSTLPSIRVQNLQIGPDVAPFIIVEMSGNHNQSLERALQIVDAAAEAGAHALKIQTYTADTMTLDIDKGEFFIEDAKSLWRGNSLYKLYQQAYTPWEWHEAIFKRCKERGILGFSTPFDPTAVDFLESLNVPMYKIASFENGDLPLIRKVAATGKPLIISTGLSTQDNIREAVEAARKAGCKELILLKCTSAYPADPADANLLTIPNMQKTFDCHVGLSDHTLGLGVSIGSVTLGAVVIERHVTLSRSEGGVDAAFSLEPAELKQLVQETHRAWQALGKVDYSIREQEKNSLRFKRSLYIAQDMQAGDVLSAKNLRSIRPGYGLPPKYYDSLLGKKVQKDVKRGTAMSWELLEPAEAKALQSK